MTYVVTCAECLRLVATAGPTELTAAVAVTGHCRTCADCAGVVDEVAREARRLADTLDGTPPGDPAHAVALRAIAGAARGRRRARRLRTALSMVAVIAVPPVAWVLLGGAGAGSIEMRTVELQCLAPHEAMELARPSLPARVRVTTRESVHLPILTLHGTQRDLATAERLIARLDARWGTERSAYCASVPRTDAPNTNAPTSGRTRDLPQ